MSKQPEHGQSKQTEAVEWDSELSTRTITWSGVVILGLILFAMVGMFFLTKMLAGDELERDLEPAAVLEQVGVPEIPGPALQATPELDLEALRTSERKVLDYYGWVDEDAGIARIPIDRAMEMIASGDQAYPPSFPATDSQTGAGDGNSEEASEASAVERATEAPSP